MKFMNKEERNTWYKENKGQNISTENFNYVDTSSIQFNSLFSFADTLGYDYIPYPHHHFERRFLEGYKGAKFISFNTMVSLHNSTWSESDRDGYFVPIINNVKNYTFTTNRYILTQAQSTQIVSFVFLNGGKRDPVCYKNAVEFVDPSYEELFLKKLIKEEAKKVLTEENMNKLIFGEV